MSTDAARESLRAARICNLGELTVQSERRGDVHTIKLAGELDLANAAQVEQQLKRAEATDAATIMLDLSGLSFIDSTGIGLLICAQGRSRADSNRLTMLRGPAAVQRVFDICGVNEMLPFAD